MATSIFTKIIAREIPATIRYEDDEFIAIDDINPKAPVHILVIPKKPYSTLEEVSLEDVTFHANLLQTVRKVAAAAGIAENYKIFLNVGKRVQQVHHIHVHVTGGWDTKQSIKTIEDEAAKLINS
ncbi:MAG: HIT domain-containing protein [Pseudomonadales bacterium]|nr:HIT domain-containing protein [Pseudomonadales bacterium]